MASHVLLLGKRAAGQTSSTLAAPWLAGDTQKPGGKWLQYDEKFILQPAVEKSKHDQKDPLGWLRDIRDYVAGRTEEVDASLNWTEMQEENIDDMHMPSGATLVDRALSVKEASRQSWDQRGSNGRTSACS